MFGGNKPPPEYGSNQGNPSQPQGVQTFQLPEGVPQPTPTAAFPTVSGNAGQEPPAGQTTASTSSLFGSPPVSSSSSSFGNLTTTSAQVPAFGREVFASSFKTSKQPEQTGSVFTSPSAAPFSNVFGKTGFGAPTFTGFQSTAMGNPSTPIFSSSTVKPTSTPALFSAPNLFAVPSNPKTESISQKPDAGLEHQTTHVISGVSSTKSTVQPSLFGGKSATFTPFGGYGQGATSTGYSFGKNVGTVPVFPVKGNPFASGSSSQGGSKDSSLFPKANVFGGASYPGTDKIRDKRESSPSKVPSERRNVFHPQDQTFYTKEQQLSFPQSTSASFQTIQQRDPRTARHRSRATTSSSPPSSSRHTHAFRKAKELEDIDAGEKEDSSKRPSLQRSALGLFQQALAGIKNKPSTKSSTKLVATVKEEIPAKQRRVSEEVEARAAGHEVLLMSPEQASSLKSILCKGIPAEFNTERFIRHKFSRFGKVSRVYCNTSKDYVIIHFSSNKAASDAKRLGSIIFPVSPPVVIFWSQTSKKKDSPEIKTVPEKKPKPSSHLPIVQSSMSDDSEIAEELRSMSSCNVDTQKFLERPTEKPHRSSRGSQSGSEKTRQIEKPRHVERSSSTDKSSRKGSKSLNKVTSSRTKKAGSSSRSAPALPAAELPELPSSLLQVRAVAAGDRFRLLDQRDKLLRQTIKKDTNVETAANLRGTCPDMCPEKERYLREDRGQLHLFEMESMIEQESGGPDEYHKAAVKEYSRSSADQEEPLPHELRPSDTLSVTMDYLVCNFMDKLEQSDTSASEWFDFLWNRTRAIRKDITQQHLCDLTTVALVEKCARFHIHCSHYLCEEDRSTFDQKINDENLTKCLQTLKHLYHDLKIKGISCLHEAEFRAYDVLLNLFQGDTLRQVQTLSPHVQTSPEVRFALQVFGAFNSNNYVRFYKLVMRASYLNACIMHRYFNRVRTRALHTLVRAHCPSANPVLYSLLEFQRMLAFENIEEATTFCNAHGITVDGEHLTLDRGTVSPPESLSYPKRGLQMVDSKRTCAIGEIVNGGPFPPNPSTSYLPHNSFTPDGHLNPNSLDASDQIRGSVQVTGEHPMITELQSSSVAEATVVQRPPPIFIAPPPPPVSPKPEPTFAAAVSTEHVVVSNEVIKDVARDLILFVLGDMLQEVAYDCLTNAQALTNVVISLTSCYLIDAADTGVKELVHEVIKESKLEWQQLQDAERVAKEEAAVLEELRNNIVQETQLSFLDDVVKSETSSVVRQVVSELRAEEDQLISDCCERYLEDLVLNTVDKDALAIADESYMKAVRRDCILKKAATFASKLRLKTTGHFFRHWREMVAKSRRLRRSEEEFPAIPGLGIHSSPGNEDERSFDVTTPLERLSEQMALCKLVDLGLQYQMVSTNFQALPLNIVAIVAPFMFTNLTQPPPPKSSTWDAYWKLIVSLPGFSDLYGSRQQVADACKWLNSKLSKQATGIGDLDQLQTLSLYTADVDTKETHPGKRLSVCIKAIDGFLNPLSLMAIQQMQQLRGTQAVLYVLPPPPPATAKRDAEFWREQNQRLEQVLELCKSDPPVPLLVWMIRWDESNVRRGDPFQRLRLETLKRQKKISSYFVIALGGDFIGIEALVQLHKGISLLAQNVPLAPTVNRKYLCEFVEDVVTNLFLVPAYENLARRESLGLVSQSSETLLELYNAAIDHAVKVINLTCGNKFPSPVVEFCESPDHQTVPPLYWNSSHHAAQLTKLVTALKLPMYETHNFDSWDDICEDVREYVASVTVSDANSAILKSRINSLLKKTHYTFQEQCRIFYYARDVEPSEDNLPWTEIIQACTDYKLNLLPAGLLVFYFDKQMQSFKVPDSWRQSLKETHEDVCTKLDETLNRAAMKRKFATSFREKDRQQKRRLTAIPVVNTGRLELEKSSVELLISKIRAERTATEELDKTLQLAVQDVYTLPDPVWTPSSSPTTLVTTDSSVQRRHSVPSYTSLATCKSNVHDRLAELRFTLKSERDQSRMFERRLKMIECLENFS